MFERLRIRFLVETQQWNLSQVRVLTNESMSFSQVQHYYWLNVGLYSASVTELRLRISVSYSFYCKC